MYKIFAVIICFVLSVSAIYAENTPNPRMRKNKIDWKQAEGERQKRRAKFAAEHKKYVETLKTFHQRFLQAETEQEKNNIRKELNDFLTKDFNRKIEFSKKRIENMKKFVEKLEEEQKNMESKAPDIVKKRTEEILQGKITKKHHK